MNDTDTTTTTPSTRTRTNGRRPAPRPEQLAAEATLAETTAAAKPALSPEAQTRLEKERQKLAKEQRAAEARARRIAALEAGEELPTPTRGLPPVVKMNELGALTRQLHRALKLAESPEALALATTAGIETAQPSTIAFLRAARNEGIATWTAQHKARVAAGAADNDTLHPLGLEEEASGDYRLVEKKKPE